MPTHRIQPGAHRETDLRLEPFLFSADTALVTAVASIGVPLQSRVGAVVVDWERSEKSQRQAAAKEIIGVSTQIAPDTPADLRRIVEISAVPVLCRIDAWRQCGPADLEAAVAAGAAEIILPMVRGPEEVAEALDLAAGRVGVGVMIETVDAVASAEEIASLPISRAYVGLMDLAIERRTHDIFDPLYDGVLERMSRVFAAMPFGFGGLTLPGLGHPIPTRLLAAEMVRLGCDFTFLRRSFIRDSGDDPASGVAAIREMIQEMTARSPDRVTQDRQLLATFIGGRPRPL